MNCALNYYIENYTNDWLELKSKLLNRLDHETLHPIVELFNTKYDIKTGIKTYFDVKRGFRNFSKVK